MWYHRVALTPADLAMAPASLSGDRQAIAHHILCAHGLAFSTTMREQQQVKPQVLHGFRLDGGTDPTTGSPILHLTMLSDHDAATLAAKAAERGDADPFQVSLLQRPSVQSLEIPALVPGRYRFSSILSTHISYKMVRRITDDGRKTQTSWRPWSRDAAPPANDEKVMSVYSDIADRMRRRGLVGDETDAELYAEYVSDTLDGVLPRHRRSTSYTRPVDIVPTGIQVERASVAITAIQEMQRAIAKRSQMDERDKRWRSVRTASVSGVLQVTDPAAAMAAIQAGIGPERYAGLGMILIRRIP